MIIVGGGAAGMIAAIILGREKKRVALYEKNEKLGKKLFITGKGRCNLTNACEVEELFESVVTNPKFLYSSFYGFDNAMTMGFFEELGLALKTERGNRVFPLSDKSSDVIKVLEREMRAQGVEINLNSEVKKIHTKEEKFACVELKNKEKVYGKQVLIATGGLSYPITGSTGDGYRFATDFGMKVTDLRPGLVPIETKEEWVKELQGLSLRNVGVRMENDKKKLLYEEFGEMIFTHYGVSGPTILSGSSVVAKELQKQNIKLIIDLKAALDERTLDERLLREFKENINKQFKNVVSSMFPSKILPVILKYGPILPEKKINEITREERREFIDYIKNFTITLTGLRPIKEGIITQGGVSVKEVNPGTMESKKIEGVYFAGEVLDVDALTGGFNLQIAWSTGCLAARSIIERK